ncbi:MAG: DNA-3-methyladenine glycosylase [Bacillota bacterium]|nr:DNA-3-methyladenine glycosylase [Clostridia bacterium]
MKQLKIDFFERDTVQVAKELLGKIMEVNFAGEKLSGMIVETEAYLGKNDPGSHSFRGKTKRNATMFGPAGISYIYQIYGIYFCYNVTTDYKDIPAAVLIRALEPLTGIETMKKNRGRNELRDLCSGPAKLVQAMGITKEMDGTSAIDGPVKFYEDLHQLTFQIIQTTRIGLSQGKELKLRFYIKNNPFISRK